MRSTTETDGLPSTTSITRTTPVLRQPGFWGGREARLLAIRQPGSLEIVGDDADADLTARESALRGNVERDDRDVILRVVGTDPEHELIDGIGECFSGE